ncbi:protein of unknown function [Alteribacillus persepolensis]|uniref:DUF4352 domain-containing protein n=1 Tax=Alteribacillus persepolensis TaxID=568899 RepID=A0A1G7YZC1_9BACI|nr:DUF4352 domain-containing protein [Alteribacillus persepolensis]SDH01754.1 protein of unknown function [Alteribacillus persepolensis]
MDKKYWFLLALTLILGVFSGMFIESQRHTGENIDSSSDQFTQTVAADSEHLLEMGETGRVNRFDITVHDAYIMSQEEKHYVIVDVSFLNTAEEVREIPLFNTIVVDESGHTSEYETTHDDQRLVGGQIRPEGLRRGTIAFPVKSSSHYEFSYVDHTGRGMATWKLELNEEKNA